MLESFRDHMRRHHMTHVAGALLGLAAAAVLTVVIVAAPAGPAQASLEVRAASAQAAAGPTTPALRVAAAADGAEPTIRLQDLTPAQARQWNAANPSARLPNPAAKPFQLDAAGMLDEARALDCMTAAIYYEAGAESLEGQRAIAQVVLNRLRHPAFPKSVCGVIFQGSAHRSGCQFSFTCDGALARTPDPRAWAGARRVAEAALNGFVLRRIGQATHYHAVYVAPYWSPALVKVSTIGAHVFYRWTGGAGRPPAFAGRYAGAETQGVQIALLDELARKSARLSPAAGPMAGAEVSGAGTEPAVAASETAAAVAPVGPTPAIALQPASVALAGPGAVGAGELDWQGRPRDRGAPRLARPAF